MRDSAPTRRMPFKVLTTGMFCCWQDRRPDDGARYEAARRQAGSPVVSLFDRVDLGKSPCKHPAKKS